jgi:tRNA (mo5U34)-methyltransferase
MKLFDFSSFINTISSDSNICSIKNDLMQATESALQKKDGNLVRWVDAFNRLPSINTDLINFDKSEVTFGRPEEIKPEELKALKHALKKLSPWRKGPFNLFGLTINSEWRSNLKWERAIKTLPSLAGKTILDVGCGNGYHLFKMLGMGAKLVIGIDPSLLFFTQFQAIKSFKPDIPAFFLPIGAEDLPEAECFDRVFAMGVFYHRKSPFDFLKKLKSLLTKDGVLILETLVIEGNENTVLVPEQRYARMRNVFFIPSPSAMTVWLKKAGFKNIEVGDISRTTVKEQRPTEWMTWESLEHCLNKSDPELTAEGYPAPERAFFIARN